MNKYFVHRYDVIRVKVAVEADSQAEAMVKADEFLEGQHPIPNFDNTTCESDEDFVADVGCPVLIHYETAEETTGYLVDEFGDEEFERSRFYNESGSLAEGGF